MASNVYPFYDCFREIPTIETIYLGIPNDYNEILYIKSSSPIFGLKRYCGYKEDYLINNLTELEQNYVICPVCKGIMRDAVVSVLHSSTISCKTCSKLGGCKPIQKVRDSISKLKIRCPLLTECDWKGELSKAEIHLEECKHVSIRCSLHCGETLKRFDKSIHEEELCPLRNVSCEYCARTGLAEDLEDHLEECPECKIDCPNGCAKEVIRKDVDEHNEECKKFKLYCPFEMLEDTYLESCEESIQREYLPLHNEQQYIVHINMLRKQLVSLENRLDELELKVKCKKDLDGCEWDMDKQSKGPEFYVHGYKLQITDERQPDGDISFKIKRIKGDNDERLSRASITECRIMKICRDIPNKSDVDIYPMKYDLVIGTESEPFGYYEDIYDLDMPIFRFYFDTDNTQIAEIQKKYEKIEIISTTF
ncbi:TNF receptor-associated factor 5-like [Oopsacas minuta]|uniref:TNF receptor-associated factor 5-like n=1 Tax=Oopsacas minuta TaxID=111878 RepID=A0AAV7KCN8_9METZ|nr:TNF receptor-associated factor 5-like [Oopsacas minuta]